MILITRTMRDVRNHRMGRARLVWSTYVVLREDVDTTACNELSQFLIFVICYCHQMCPWTLSDMQSRVLDVMSDHRYITNLTSNKFPSIGEFWRNITESTGWLTDWSDVSVWGDLNNWEQSDNTQAPPSQPGGKYCVTDRDWDCTPGYRWCWWCWLATEVCLRNKVKC